MQSTAIQIVILDELQYVDFSFCDLQVEHSDTTMHLYETQSSSRPVIARESLTSLNQ